MSQRADDLSEQILSQSYLDRFSGVGRIYGVKSMYALSQARICVIGIGGVGTWCAEALARSGIGSITLVDLDEICVTNMNRQLHTLTDTIGQSKVETMKTRLQKINPELIVHAKHVFYTKNTEDELLGKASQSSAKFDLVIDAIDHTERKAQLIEACLIRGLAVVTCGAAGGRRSPQMITCADLSQSSHDGLLRRVKQLLRKTDYIQALCNPTGAVQPKQVSSWDVPAVFSKERPYFPTKDGDVCHQSSHVEALRLDCNLGFGSLSFVTATFGFIAVSVGLNIILNENPYG